MLPRKDPKIVFWKVRGIQKGRSPGTKATLGPGTRERAAEAPGLGEGWGDLWQRPRESDKSSPSRGRGDDDPFIKRGVLVKLQDG